MEWYNLLPLLISLVPLCANWDFAAHFKNWTFLYSIITIIFIILTINAFLYLTAEMRAAETKTKVQQHQEMKHLLTEMETMRKKQLDMDKKQLSIDKAFADSEQSKEEVLQKMEELLIEIEAIRLNQLEMKTTLYGTCPPLAPLPKTTNAAGAATATAASPFFKFGAYPAPFQPLAASMRFGGPINNQMPGYFRYVPTTAHFEHPSQQMRLPMASPAGTIYSPIGPTPGMLPQQMMPPTMGAGGGTIGGSSGNNSSASMMAPSSMLPQLF